MINMDNNTAIEMFDALWAPGAHSLCVQTNGHPFHSMGFYDDPTKLLRTAETFPPETNVWWGVHGMKAPARGRGGVDDVTAVTCLAADFDWADSTAHKGASLPSESEVRSAVMSMPEPTVVVNSGHGLQVYWGLTDVLGPLEGQELSDGFFRFLEAEFGLHNDRTDLASVLRLPGSFNNKGEPVEVVIESNGKLGYFAEFLRQNFWLPVKQRDDRGGGGDTATERQSDGRSRRGASQPDHHTLRTAGGESSPASGTPAHMSGHCPVCAAPLSADGSCATPSCTWHGTGGSIGQGGHGALHTTNKVSFPDVTVKLYDDGETPFDWLNRTFDALSCLVRLGWQESSRRSGVEIQFTRPGKDPRQGTSATYHVDTGAVNIYSTTLDPIYTTVGLPGRGCVTLKPADLWMVENGITDRSEASRLIRQQMPQQNAPRAAAKTTPGAPVQEADTRQDVAVEANLPDEFWESRPYLSAIRAAAVNRQASADAVLGAVIARYAAAIPPSFSIPPIIMTASTFDHLTVLVAESSGGKSGAMSIARELFPGPDYKEFVWDFPTPSGEGLVSAFFEMKEKEVDGKKSMVNTKTKTAVHFSVDEAMALVESSGRQGATIGSVICTAWSGGDPGQGNASADRRRVGMNPGTYRMAGVAAIQLSLGYRLLEDTFVQQGLSGRLVFFAAEDASTPHWSERPAWPGQLNLPIHPTMPVMMEYASSIEDEIREQNWLKLTKRVHVAPIDGHLNLVKLKLSGIFALMDGRMAVTDDDWALAGIVVSSHLALRNRMLEVKKQHAHERTVTAATAQAMFEDTKEDVRERRAIASLRATIIRHVPEEGITRGPLRKATVSSKTKHRFDAALAGALHDGAIKMVDDRYFLM